MGKVITFPFLLGWVRVWVDFVDLEGMNGICTCHLSLEFFYIEHESSRNAHKARVEYLHFLLVCTVCTYIITPFVLNNLKVLALAT